MPLPAVAKYHSDIKELEALFKEFGLPRDTPVPAYDPAYVPGNGPIPYIVAVGAVAAATIVVADDLSGIGIANDIPALSGILKFLKELFPKIPTPVLP